MQADCPEVTAGSYCESHRPRRRSPFVQPGEGVTVCPTISTSSTPRPPFRARRGPMPEGRGRLVYPPLRALTPASVTASPYWPARWRVEMPNVAALQGGKLTPERQAQTAVMARVRPLRVVFCAAHACHRVDHAHFVIQGRHGGPSSRAGLH
jgi:hypothetical protein